MMKLSKMAIALALTSLLSFSALPAEASLWPGLATKDTEKSGAFRTDDFVDGNATMKSPYLVTRENNEVFSGKVNAAIGREKQEFLDELDKSNEVSETLGWMIWHEGLIGNYISNMQGITSIVLVRQTLEAGAAHGMTYTQGLNFNSAGELLTLKEVLPDLTVYDVNQCIETTAKKKNIKLFSNHEVTELPTNFYVGKNRVVYAIYQPYDISPYSEGVLSIAIGKL